MSRHARPLAPRARTSALEDAQRTVETLAARHYGPLRDRLGGVALGYRGLLDSVTGPVSLESRHECDRELLE